MKLGMLSCLVLLSLSSVAMADMRIDLNGGERRLDECGGTIEATVSTNHHAPDQVNLVLRNVEKCSNFVLKATHKQYKLAGNEGERGGSFSISAGKMQRGWNKLKLTVRSNSGKSKDDVSIWVNVVP